MKKIRIAIGISLMPLFAAIYFTDRIMTVAMPWIEHVKIHKWFSGTKEMTASFVRVLTAVLIYGFYQLIVWIL